MGPLISVNRDLGRQSSAASAMSEEKSGFFAMRKLWMVQVRGVTSNCCSRHLLRNCLPLLEGFAVKTRILLRKLRLVRLEGETLNTFDELIEVFEDWNSQLRDANLEQIDGLVGEFQDECEPSCDAAQHDLEPGGMS